MNKGVNEKTIDNIKRKMGKIGFKFISLKVENDNSIIEYLCSNGHNRSSKINYICGSKKITCRKCSGKEKYDYDYVKKFFEENRCTLISKSYTGNNQKLEYKCSCGEISQIRFRSFQHGNRCKKCQNKRSIETNKNNHNGIFHFCTKKFRDNYIKNSIKKFGVESPFKSEIVKEKIKATNLKRYGCEKILCSDKIKEKIKKTMIRKYGKEYVMQIPKFRKKFKETLIKKYGVPSLAYLSRPASKESQKLFWEIYNKLDGKYKKKCYFSELNKEFVFGDKNGYFKYDFVNSEFKKIIEYNGKNFHPHPLQNENETKWCAFHPLLSVKEARENENKKIKSARNRGFSILIVWDYEYRKNKDEIIKRCFDFITESN